MLNLPRKNHLIIGIGNDLRGDDSFGIRMVRFLQMKHPDLAEYVILKQDLTNLIDIWNQRNVIIIDAAFSKKMQPGRVHLSWSVEELIADQERHYSSHGLGLMEALKISKVVNKLPSSLLFVGVEGEHWEFGSSLSENVEDSIPFVEWRVVNYVSKRDPKKKELV